MFCGHVFSTDSGHSYGKGIKKMVNCL